MREAAQDSSLDLSRLDPAARLAFERVGPRTVVTRAVGGGPLRLLTPANHGHAAWAYTSSLGGGFVDGDRVRLELAVGPFAAAVVATQGSTRVYRSPRGCRSETVAEVGPSALLALLPDPTVCFADARYESRCEVRLAPGGSLVLVDALAAGRSARGERWAFSRYASRLLLVAGCRTVLDETVLLDPAHGPLAERLGRFEVLATMLLAGSGLREPREELRGSISARPLSRRAERIESASALGEDALLVRIAATSVEDAACAIRGHLRFLPTLLGDDPWTRRGSPCT
jgi:urease accessory protein